MTSSHGEADGYGRAMGEGNADWYAFVPSGQPAMGYVALPPWGLRNIDNWKGILMMSIIPTGEFRRSIIPERSGADTSMNSPGC